jgi:hypothetical protein
MCSKPTEIYVFFGEDRFVNLTINQVVQFTLKHVRKIVDYQKATCTWSKFSVPRESETQSIPLHQPPYPLLWPLFFAQFFEKQYASEDCEFFVRMLLVNLAKDHFINLDATTGIIAQSCSCLFDSNRRFQFESAIAKVHAASTCNYLEKKKITFRKHLTKRHFLPSHSPKCSNVLVPASEPVDLATFSSEILVPFDNDSKVLALALP